MKYFLPDGKYTFGFRFKQKYPNVQPWISLGLAGKPHLGDDLICNDITGIASLSGRAEYHFGSEGGHTMHFFPDGRNHLIRLMHLKSKETTKTGRINKGDKVFITDNSGASTTPHEHCDVWNLDFGALNPGNVNGFLNPTDYAWEETPSPMPTQFPIPERWAILMNRQPSWATLADHIQHIKDWAFQNSGGKIQVTAIDVINTNLPPDWPIEYVPAFGGSESYPRIKEDWFDQHIMPLAPGYDAVIFVPTKADWHPPIFNGAGYEVGWCYGGSYLTGGNYPMKALLGVDENDDYVPNFAGIYGLSKFVLHEIMGHGHYSICCVDTLPAGTDLTHVHYYGLNGQPQQFTDIFKDFDYDKLSLKLKGVPMLVYKFDDNATVYVLADDATLIGATAAGLTKTLAGRPQKLVVLPAAQRSNFTLTTGAIN